MKISPVSFGSLASSKQQQQQSPQPSFGERISPEPDCIPLTSRKNTLADLEFNIVADKIRCQNLKYQMTARLMNLKNCIAKDTYS